MKGYGAQPSSWQCAQKAPPSRGAREGKVSGCIILDRGSRLDPNGDDLELHGRHALDYNPEQALGSSLDEQTLPRLLEAQHELVDRPGRAIDVEVARVLGVTQEVTFGHELEARGFHLAAQHGFLDPM